MGTGPPKKDDKVKETFTDMWISFLMKETSNPDLSIDLQRLQSGTFDYSRRPSSVSTPTSATLSSFPTSPSVPNQSAFNST